MAQKVFVILHDGTMDGDCAGDPMGYIELLTPPDELTLKEAKELRRKQMQDDGDWGPDDIKEELKSLKGAWIVTEATTDLMDEVLDAVDPGSDSGVYALQRALKAIARTMATRIIGKKAS